MTGRITAGTHAFAAAVVRRGGRMVRQDGGPPLRQLVARDNTGAHVVPDVEARAVVALLSLAVRKANPAVELHAFVIGTVGNFAVDARVAPQDPPDTMIHKLETHLIGLLSPELRNRPPRQSWTACPPCWRTRWTTVSWG